MLQNEASAIINYLKLYPQFNDKGKAMLLAQCHHESSGFSRVIENLNYSVEGLLKIFPKYFDKSNAYRYANNPELIANRVYSNRMGNGSEKSGDGFKYRGRGYIQITGRYNYTQCGKTIYKNLEYTPDILCQNKYAALSAIWFFITHNLVNCNDIVHVTKVINGGINGLDNRERLYSMYLENL